jgi:hypothetical protein
MTHNDQFTQLTAAIGAWIPRQSQTRSSAPAADAAFQRLALDLFRCQSRAIAHLRNLCQLRGINPDTVGDWRSIPALPTRAFKEYEVTSLPPADRMVTFHSSQTTGQTPSRHFHDAASLALYECSALTWFRTATGLASGERRRVLALTPPASQAPHSSLVHMFELLRREHGDGESRFLATADGAGGWQIKASEAWDAIRSAAAANVPVTLLGTAFSYVHLLDAEPTATGAAPLPAGSLVLETGGYKGRSRTLPKPELHELLCRRFAIASHSIVCEYGMSELSSQAYDRLAGEHSTAPQDAPRPARVFRFPPWARALVSSPETGREVADGESGLLRVFDLANVRSVIAIQTEDLAVRRGHGFELLGRAAQAEPRGCSLLPAATA